MKIDKKIISIILAIIVIMSGGGVYLYYDSAEEQETKATINEVIVSDEIIDIIDSVDVQVKKGEGLESDSTIKGSFAEEEKINDEGLLETDGVVEQENISYDGINDKSGKDLLSGVPKLTYYSQADSRWGSIMYSSHNDRSQTIKTSGCGPTSAAMIISASKGITTPPVIAQLFNDNKMRTYSNGTAWNAWPFIADYFDFNFYKPTTSFKEASYYLKQDKNNDGISDYFAILSCGSGLFTTGGHYIFCPGWDFVKKLYIVYDPYNYPGKFDTSSRKVAGVKINGNIARVSESSLQKYGAVKQYWIYSNDSGDVKTESKTTTKLKNNSTKPKTKTMYVNTKTDPLNVRMKPKQNAKKIRQLKRCSKVTVYETKNGWSRIGKNEWVNATYLSSKKPTITTFYKTTLNKTYKFTAYTSLYSKPSLSGTSYYYKPHTSFIVKEHYSSTIDKIYIPATGRTVYWKVENFI